jgi:6-phosphogluconolactonase
MSGPDVVTVRDADDAGARAAVAITEGLSAAVAERGRADWATTGGSTPTGIYRAMLDPSLRRLPWEQVHTWWGDDRFVPSDHPLSNVRPFDDVLLEGGGWETVHSDDHRDRIRIPVDNVHPFRTGAAIGLGRDAAWCAADLAAELSDAGVPEVDGWPAFDLVLLGLGPDGHVLSVFPGSEAFDSKDWALAIPAPTHVEPRVQRVTLNPEVVRVAQRVLVVATGVGKADVVARILREEVDPRDLPGRLAVRDGATWIVDEAAAAGLR